MEQSGTPSETRAGCVGRDPSCHASYETASKSRYRELSVNSTISSGPEDVAAESIVGLKRLAALPTNDLKGDSTSPTESGLHWVFLSAARTVHIGVSLPICLESNGGSMEQF